MSSKRDSHARKPTSPRRGSSDSSPPTPWSIDQINQLLTVARNSDGEMCGIPSRQWWPAFLLTLLDTALPYLDLLRTTRDDFDHGLGRLGVGLFVYTLNRRTADLINIACQHKSPRNKLFPVGGGSAALVGKFRHLTRLVAFQLGVSPSESLESIRLTGMKSPDIVDALDLSTLNAVDRPLATTLTGFASEYPSLILELKSETAYFYDMCARRLTEFHGQQIELTALGAPLVLAWLKYMTDQGLAATSVNSYRATILTLWRAAAARKRAPEPPNKLELPKRRVPRRSPVAWMPTEMERLLEACSRLRKSHQLWPDIRRCDFWTSLVLVLYESGARIGAALEVTPADVDLEKRLIRLDFSQSKTLTEQWISISQQTADAIAKIFDRKRAKVWPCGKHRNELYVRFKKLLDEAGLTTDRLSMFHRIRRTTATQTAAHGSLEMAQQQLGHTSVRMTLKSYIDPRIVRPLQAVDVIPALHFGPQSASDCGGHNV